MDEQGAARAGAPDDPGERERCGHRPSLRRRAGAIAPALRGVCSGSAPRDGSGRRGDRLGARHQPGEDEVERAAGQEADDPGDVHVGQGDAEWAGVERGDHERQLHEQAHRVGAQAHGVPLPVAPAVPLVQYDALPGLGHACGHNLIAASAVGAGLALARVADELGITVRVYGTPAEEGGGGKIEMIEHGAFADLDLAMMVHPAPVDVAEARPFAVAHSHVAYQGVSAHAAAYPDQGVNANDAFLIAQVAIGLLRQQLPADTRVHGIQTLGGDAPNAIPERTEGRWYWRANTLEELAELEERVRRCFEAGALATGAALTITPESKPYAEFRTDERALAAYRRAARERGRVFADPAVAGRMNRASTDMGNVSLLVPAIHPYIGVDSLPHGNHQKEFAAACVGPTAERALLDAAVLMAWTAIDTMIEGRTA
ncbi:MULTISPECIES: M20/M25/M40 family metallo-hydrolase [Microbacterium]|uniref:M20/M25/M40 family metallo-hydrolase n=1 Tax=Microbacterium TaxID=33882 RepID=UPI00300E0C25